jgi:hypothetical protein
MMEHRIHRDDRELLLRERQAERRDGGELDEVDRRGKVARGDVLPRDLEDLAGDVGADEAILHAEKRRHGQRHEPGAGADVEDCVPAAPTAMRLDEPLPQREPARPLGHEHLALDLALIMPAGQIVKKLVDAEDDGFGVGLGHRSVTP